MPRKIEWTVRVINYGSDFPPVDGMADVNNRLPGVWIEQLRYLGFCRELATFENPEREVLEFYCQARGIDTKVWAEQNAARMRSFGIDAAAAPKWGSYTEQYAIHHSSPGREKADRQSHMERLNRFGRQS